MKSGFSAQANAVSQLLRTRLRCCHCFFCLLIASCVIPSEQPAPEPTPTQTEEPGIQVYTLDAPEIGSVEALNVEAQGRVTLGQNRLDRSVYLSDYDNKVVLVNYWTSQCASCWQHMADLYRVYAEYKQSGFIVVNVNYGETKQTIVDYLATRDPNRVTIQLSDRSGQAAEAQGVVSVPAAVLYAPDRTVVGRYGNDLEVTRIRRDLQGLLQ